MNPVESANFNLKFLAGKALNLATLMKMFKLLPYFATFRQILIIY
ncbi:hypothetical protein BH11BAC4_BH11BAC4_20270 [soil metagenome]